MVKYDVVERKLENQKYFGEYLIALLEADIKYEEAKANGEEINREIELLRKKLHNLNEMYGFFSEYEHNIKKNDIELLDYIKKRLAS